MTSRDCLSDRVTSSQKVWIFAKADRSNCLLCRWREQKSPLNGAVDGGLDKIHPAGQRGVMKLPGPDHPISIARNDKRVRVTFAGVTIADSTLTLILKEAGYPAV